MKVGSLFSGIGGIEIGFEKAGFKTEWFIENEPYAQEILKKRFPEAKIYGDVTKVNFNQIPTVEILTGGFPCQDISNAGKRAGIEGSRSSLWKWYLKAISTIRPRITFIENVSALLGRGLSTVLCDLAKVGYDAEWYCVPASAVGANHQRDRVFIIAYPNGFRRNNGSNHREERHIQDYQERSIEEGESEGNGREHRIGETCSDVPDTSSERLERQMWQELQESSPNRESSRQSMYGWWATEPNVGRVAHGVSFRVDRIKCLGNAVVPQVAEVFAEAIKEGEETKKIQV